MAAVIQVKRGSASSWTSANTVLAAGEIGFETDTKKMKVGDGSTAWTSLGYTVTDGDITGVTAGTGLSGGGTSGAVTLNLSTPVAATDGGTAQTTYATGDLLYASASNTLSKRTIGTTGQVLTVSGGVPSWATPTSASFVGARAYNDNFSQAFTGGVEVTIPFPNENFDTNGFHDNVTNNTRLTIPSGYAGKYLVIANIDLNGVSGYYICGIRQFTSGGGGITPNGLNRQFSQNSGGNNFAGGTQAWITNCSAGDYFTMTWQLGQTGTLSSNYAALQCIYLGA